jgi:hypothetical protein
VELAPFDGATPKKQAASAFRPCGLSASAMPTASGRPTTTIALPP